MTRTELYWAVELLRAIPDEKKMAYFEELGGKIQPPEEAPFCWSETDWHLSLGEVRVTGQSFDQTINRWIVEANLYNNFARDFEQCPVCGRADNNARGGRAHTLPLTFEVAPTAAGVMEKPHAYS